MKNKADLTEIEIRNLYIRPAIVNAGWQPIIQMYEEEITKGQVIEKGNAFSRNKSKKYNLISHFITSEVFHLPLLKQKAIIFQLSTVFRKQLITPDT